MPKHNLLLADADPKSLRILEVALRRAGFGIATAGDGAEAMRRIRAAAPDLVLADVYLPTQDGFAVCRSVREDDRLGTIPILLMSSDRDPEVRNRAAESGADDFLEKPILVKELVARIRDLLSQRAVAITRSATARATPAALSGSVGDLGLVDLFNSLETWQKSAIVHCEDGERTATVWVKDGQVTDAEVETLAGEAAFYRLLGWEKGTFRVEFGNFIRTPRTEVGTQALLLEGMRRIDEAGRLAEALPPTLVLSVDFDVLARRLGDLPDEVNGVLRLVDGRRTLKEVLAGSALDDLSTLAVVQRLLGEHVVRKEHQPASEEAPRKPSLEQWLGSEPLVWTPAQKPQEERPDAAAADTALEASGGDGAAAFASLAEELEAISLEPGPPPPDLQVVHYAPVAGARKERLRRENDLARADIASGRPVRLTRVVEMPPSPDGSDAVPEQARHASDAVGEAAQRFAPDPVLARIVPWADQRWRTWTPAEKGGGVSPVPAAPLLRPVPSASEEPAAAVRAEPPAPAARESLAPPSRAGMRLAAVAAVVCLAGVAVAFAFRPWRSATPPAPAQSRAEPRAAAPQPPAVEAKAPAAEPPVAAPAPSPRPSPADEYARALRQGEALLKRGHYKDAAKELRKAVQIDGKSVPALLALGDALLEADQAQGALQPLQQAAELEPRNARAQLLLGTAYQSLKRNKDALKAYRRYLDLDPQGEFAGDVRAILTNLARNR